MSHIYIDGVKIIQNKGVDTTNVLNFLNKDLTTGKSWLKALGDSSQELKFKTLLTDKQLPTYLPLYQNLVEKTKTTPVPIIIDDLRFMGKITSFTQGYPIEYYTPFDWVVIEDADFKAETKEFQTFNYKKPTVTTTKTPAKTNAPSWLKSLYACNVKVNCSKSKVKCVYYIQDLMRMDGYYLNYKRDGLWCTYTSQELKKWKKKHKIKTYKSATWDKYCKAYIKKRFNLTTTAPKSKSISFSSAIKNPLS